MNTYSPTARRIGAALSQSKLAAAKLALVLFVGAFQPFLPVEEQPAGLSSDAPALSVQWPHTVGYRPRDIGEGTEQRLALRAWYPALIFTGADKELSSRMPVKDAK